MLRFLSLFLRGADPVYAAAAAATLESRLSVVLIYRRDVFVCSTKHNSSLRVWRLTSPECAVRHTRWPASSVPINHRQSDDFTRFH